VRESDHHPATLTLTIEGDRERGLTVTIEGDRERERPPPSQPYLNDRWKEKETPSPSHPYPVEKKRERDTRQTPLP
jgi:hypothetical protein